MAKSPPLNDSPSAVALRQAAQQWIDACKADGLDHPDHCKHQKAAEAANDWFLKTARLYTMAVAMTYSKEAVARVLNKHAEIDFYDARCCDDVAEEILKLVFASSPQQTGHEVVAPEPKKKAKRRGQKR